MRHTELCITWNWEEQSCWQTSAYIININTRNSCYCAGCLCSISWRVMLLLTSYFGEEIPCVYLNGQSILPFDQLSKCFCICILSMTNHFFPPSNGNNFAWPPSNPASMLLLPMQTTKKKYRLLTLNVSLKKKRHLLDSGALFLNL